MAQAPLPCDIATLASETPLLGQLDKVDFQAAKVWLLAQLLKALGGTDYTATICDLAKEMQQYDSLPDYKRRTIQIQVIVNSLISLDVTAITEQETRDAIKCLHCCDSTNQSLETTEWFLWCQIAASQNRVL